MSISAQASLILALCTLLAACRGNESYGNTPVRQRGVGPPQPVEPSPAADEPSSTFSPKLLPLRVDEKPEEQQPEQPAEQQPETLPAAEAAPDKPVRDLSRELETMMGSPANCLAQRAAQAGPGELRLSLSASVMPSGTVGRGEVSASSELSKAELDCLRTRLESLKFAAPIENAPRTVSGSITLTRGS